jgi:hypothetical protein
MILVDLSQVLISALMVHVNENPKEPLSESAIRHTSLNCLRSYNRQFHTKFGSIVICCDSKRYWRRDVFPYYKANRKHDREASKYDWELIFDVLNKMREELKVSYPHKVLEVEGAEADDIIAVLCKRFADSHHILILSSDKDFIQLQKHANVQQYSPKLKRFIRADDPDQFIREHIIRGDRRDGIPNFLSPDDTFVTGERQRRITKAAMAEWLVGDPAQFCTTDAMKRGYDRNEMLVNFDYIPSDLVARINETYDATISNPRTAMMRYLADKRMTSLIERADEF